NYESRFDRIDIDLAAVKSELAMVKWIVSEVGFGVLLLVLRSFWRVYGSFATSTRTVPSASAITRRVLASNSMLTRRRLVTAASTVTPSALRRKSAMAASMLLRALAASGFRSTTAASASA